MAGDRDARNLDATKVPRVGRHTARPMEEGTGASTWDALKVQKVRPTTALHMVAEGVVGFLGVAPEQHVASQAFASSMVEERGAVWKDAPVVLRGKLACASHMVVDAVANSLVVQRVRRGALCSAKHMVVESVAYLLAAPKEPKGVRLFAKHMVVESGVSLMVVVSAPKVYTEAQTFVWPMVVGRGVLFQDAPRVLEGVLIVVSGMEVGNAASLRTVEKVLKVAPTFVRLMVAVSVVAGERGNARSLLGAEEGYVLLTAACYMVGIRIKEA